MKEIAAFHSALHKASHETSGMMTAHLRSETEASGWPSHISQHMGVTYGEHGFEAHSHDAHKSEVENLEYGTPSTEPSAAIRRFSNRTREFDTFLSGRLGHHLGEV
jgi:hypothetical protein